jgi:hypothetical protein
MRKHILLALFLAIMVAVVTWAAAPWGAFGTAQAVKLGAGANSWAIQLTSACPGFPGFGCFGDGSFTFGGVSFRQPSGTLTFAQLHQLSTDFNRTTDDCGVGSPRFQINIDTDGDGASNGNMFVYIGPQPSFTGCAAGWQSTGNLIGLPDTDPRYDLTQLGGAFYDTYNNALANFGSKDVVGIQLVVDGGWNGPATGGDGIQTILVDNVTVNNHVLSAKGFSK